MALFDASDIFKDEDHTETIELDCFQVPDGDPKPTLTILFTPDVRKLESRVSKQYNGLGKMRFVIDSEGQQRGEAELTNDPQAYCQAILKEAYKESTGIFPQPTKTLVLAAIEEKPVFARALAGELMGFFQSHDVKLKEDEGTTRKNSDDS